MADAEQTLDLSDTKHEESGDSAADEAEAEPQQTQEDTNGAKTNAEDKEPKEKSRKSHRYHPYKEQRRSGSVDLKASHRNRVFISNIPYDMKWQAIKDLMHPSEIIDMGRMGDVYRSGMGGMDRDFGRRDMEMNRPFGDSFGGRCVCGGGMVNMGMDRMNSGFDRMGGNMDMGRGFGQYGGGSGHMGGMSDRGAGTKAGCQIFVRNLSYDLTWQKLKEKFSYCGQVMYAEIKMENGKSKGCGTVRFDSPESAEKACRMMNGTQINGREVDIRIDRNA
uniref:Myelin expression factor 2 n=1 Tax=Sinocyclocheilus grahami TaxID=75366 RepID=A0A672S8S5_SINGR